MEERRKYARLKREMPVRNRPKESRNIEQTMARDISMGGMRITTNSKLEVGTKLNIEVNISDSVKPYYAMGEVVWLKKNESADNTFDMGIKFIRIVTKEDLEGF